MIIVRNSFIAKPGQAGKLASQLKNMAKAGNLRNVRVLTDLAGDFNNVIMEHEVESASEFEELITRYSSDPQAREAAKGYTDLWTTGRRELFRASEPNCRGELGAVHGISRRGLTFNPAVALNCYCFDRGWSIPRRMQAC